MRRYLFTFITKHSIRRTNYSIELMVQNMSEAIDLYDAGKGILAREVLKKALLDAEEQVISQDIIPDEPIGNGDPAES